MVHPADQVRPCPGRSDTARRGSRAGRRPRVPVPIPVELEAPAHGRRGDLPAGPSRPPGWRCRPRLGCPWRSLAPLVVGAHPPGQRGPDALGLPPEARDPRGDLRPSSRPQLRADILSFATFVELIRDALVLHKGSAPAEPRAGRGAGRPADLPRRPSTASCGGSPSTLSAGLLRGRQRADEAAAAGGPRRRRDPRVAGRDDCRGPRRQADQAGRQAAQGGAGQGRQASSAARSWWPTCRAEGLAVAMAADPEGEANDIRLMPEAISQGPGPHRGHPALGGRPPVLRPRPARAADRGGRPLPGPPLAADRLPRRPRPPGPDDRRRAGPHGRASSGAGWARRGTRGGGTCGRST